MEENYNPRGFRYYGKIHRLGKEETEGILNGTVYVQEKVDGANTSIWVDENGKILMGSRTRMLGEEEFNGFVPYVKEHVGINLMLSVHPDWRLYGEWLVRHTIAYNELSYRKFYLFDILTPEGYLSPEEIVEYAKKYQIDVVPMHGKFENPTEETVRSFVGKTQFGDRGEGIVIKNYGFRNSFGDMCFAKIVTEEFKENAAIVFGGNSRHSESYYEMYVVNKYMTLPRVRKIMEKIQPEINERLDMKHIPRVVNTCYHDMLIEEIWEIQAKVQKLDFNILKRCAQKKAKQVYVDILSGTSSVADLKSTTASY